VECFDPLITVIMDGTNGGFTALDVNSVVINPIGHIFGGTPGGVFRSMNDADQWSNVSSRLLPSGGIVWAVEASNPLPRCGSFRERSLAPTPASRP
jgi:hypothetical protein